MVGRPAEVAATSAPHSTSCRPAATWSLWLGTGGAHDSAHPPGDTAVVSVVAQPTGPWTVEDVYALPDDGNRYELLDGTLIVSASAASAHQRVSLNLAMLLHRAAPEG